jgi:hypothetical protein
LRQPTDLMAVTGKYAISQRGGVLTRLCEFTSTSVSVWTERLEVADAELGDCLAACHVPGASGATRGSRHDARAIGTECSSRGCPARGHRAAVVCRFASQIPRFDGATPLRSANRR